MKNLCFIFPGQGSQCVGMGRKLYDEYQEARQTFEEANDILGFDLMKLCFEGPLDELTKTENAQPALLTSAVALFRVYMKEVGIEPNYSAGHSLGEYSALTCSGAMNLSDALKIVRKRGQFMQEAAALGTGAMAAVSGIEKAIIEESCREITNKEAVAGIACYNSPEQIVISGKKEAVVKAMEKLTALGARCVPLNVSAPFHSPLMASAAERLSEELQRYRFGDFKWPVIANVSALPYAGNGGIVESLTAQMVKPVQWQSSMEFLEGKGVDTAIEMGPQTVLKSLMRKISKGIVTYSYDKKEEREEVGRLFSSIKNESTVTKKSELLSRCMAVAVCTKNNNWNNEEYQEGVVKPYGKIKELWQRLDKEGGEPTSEQMREALEMLRSVFITKKTPEEEQIERFNQIFNETGTRELLNDFKMIC